MAKKINPFALVDPDNYKKFYAILEFRYNYQIIHSPGAVYGYREDWKDVSFAFEPEEDQELMAEIRSLSPSEHSYGKNVCVLQLAEKDAEGNQIRIEEPKTVREILNLIEKYGTSEVTSLSRSNYLTNPRKTKRRRLYERQRDY